MSGAEIASVCVELDIFTPRTIKASVLRTVETVYKPIASVDQDDLEFLILS